VLNHQELTEKKDQVAGNIYGLAALGIGATFQMLPFYSDMQERV